jgi:hypothetical protein
MKKLLHIASKGERYQADLLWDDFPSDSRRKDSAFFVGDFDVDIDGSDHWQSDPCGQADTTLHHNGKPIDSGKVPGIVLPPECINAVKGVVLGCKATATYRGKTVDAVVFDIGPHNKLGEGSEALAKRLGINPDPNRGGVDEQEVTYRFWPGVPAVVDGICYNLQPYHHA